MESREEEKMELMKDTLNVLKELLHSTQQNGHLLTILNTGLRKNTMVLQELRHRKMEERPRHHPSIHTKEDPYQIYS